MRGKTQFPFPLGSLAPTGDAGQRGHALNGSGPTWTTTQGTPRVLPTGPGFIVSNTVVSGFQTQMPV